MEFTSYTHRSNEQFTSFQPSQSNFNKHCILPSNLVNQLSKEEEMVKNIQTLKELATPTPNQQLCILYLQLEVVFEIKSIMIHLSLTFYNFANEDPNKHFKEFYIIC